MDGAVYEWEVATSKRLHEAVLKACGYTGLGLSADAKTVFAVGTDRKIKEIVDAQVSIMYLSFGNSKRLIDPFSKYFEKFRLCRMMFNLQQ